MAPAGRPAGVFSLGISERSGLAGHDLGMSWRLIEPKERRKAFAAMLLGLGVGVFGTHQLYRAATLGVIDAISRHLADVALATRPVEFWWFVVVWSLLTLLTGGFGLALLISIFAKSKPPKFRNLAYEERFDRSVRASRDPTA